MGDNVSTVGGALGWCYRDYPIVPISPCYTLWYRLIGAYPQRFSPCQRSQGRSPNRNRCASDALENGSHRCVPLAFPPHLKSQITSLSLTAAYVFTTSHQRSAKRRAASDGRNSDTLACHVVGTCVIKRTFTVSEDQICRVSQIRRRKRRSAQVAHAFEPPIEANIEYHSRGCQGAGPQERPPMRTTPKYEGYCISPNGGHPEGVFLLRGCQPLRFWRLVGLLRSRSYRARNPVNGLSAWGMHRGLRRALA
jgi:hypothetical protein